MNKSNFKIIKKIQKKNYKENIANIRKSLNGRGMHIEGFIPYILQDKYIMGNIGEPEHQKGYYKMSSH